jgi:hypothetical protein
MFLAFDGAILLFHLDDLRVLKEVKSYLENYGFHFWMKWVVVKSLPFMSTEDTSFKVPYQFINLFLYFCSSQF